MPEPDPNVTMDAAITERAEQAVLPANTPVTPAARKVLAPGVEPRKAGAVLEPFTCAWAQDGLAKALEGMTRSASGVLEYHIGSRGLKREASKDQVANVDYWNKMVGLYCGTAPLPTSVTGRDTAVRIVMRDI